MAACPATAWPIPQPPFIVTNRFQTQLDPERLSDEALVAAARMGDASAFGRLIERHYQFCMSKAYSILRNHCDAEDEVQNACAQAWKHFRQLRGQGSFCSWLGRIVSNQRLMRIREMRSARLTSMDEVFDSDGSFRLEVIDQRALPEGTVGADEVSRVLFKEIYGVPPLLREALVMRDLHGWAMRDIAGHLRISIPAAKSRLMRARMELKQRLGKHRGEKGGGTLLQKSSRRRAAFVRAD